MSKKRAFKGLTFNYIINNKILKDRFESIDEFLQTSFPKNNNSMSATENTEITNIRWNRHVVDINSTIKTIADLKDFFNNQTYTITKTNIIKGKNRIIKRPYIRKSIHSIDDVKNTVKDVLFERITKNAKINFDGDIIKGNSQRYQTFFTYGTKCACCGIEGKFFAKEKHPEHNCYHLNLYAIDESGHEILMTKDHIIPKSRGGKNSMDNYQTMCEICNAKKGNVIL